MRAHCGLYWCEHKSPFPRASYGRPPSFLRRDDSPFRARSLRSFTTERNVTKQDTHRRPTTPFVRDILKYAARASDVCHCPRRLRVRSGYQTAAREYRVPFGAPHDSWGNIAARIGNEIYIVLSSNVSPFPLFPSCSRVLSPVANEPWRRPFQRRPAIVSSAHHHRVMPARWVFPQNRCAKTWRIVTTNGCFREAVPRTLPHPSP